MKKIIFFILFIFISIDAFSQGIGNGSDGSQNISGIINSYSKVISVSTIGCNSNIVVDSILNFQPNNLILIIQIQGASFDTTNTSNYGVLQNLNSTGNFEFSKVQSINGNSITLQSVLSHTFNTTSGKVQIVKVPQYNNVTISGILTCKKWDGTKGGILVLDAIGTVTLNDSITVSSKGFRGGVVQYGGIQINHQTDYRAFVNPNYFSNKGEGIGGYGWGNLIAGRGAVINGGGGGNAVNAGGGGGSNFGCGGLGGQGFNYPTYPGNPILAQGIGGYALSYNSSVLKLFFGGGGGAAHANDNQSFDGGDGGGIIIINCATLIGNNKNINSNGRGVQTAGIDGSSGGGAGGSILLQIQNYNSVININSIGGHGGNSTNYQTSLHGPGGGGGGGAIIFTNSITPVGASVNVNGGLQGLCSGNASYSTNGCVGGVLYNFSYPNISIGTNSSHQTISICQHDTAVLQLNNSAHHINWSPSTNLSCTNCIAPKAHPSITTTYIATDSINHCFSIDTFLVKVNLPNSVIINTTICQGKFYTLPNGNQISVSGIYKDTIPNHQGCDSIITINLSVKNKSLASVSATICKGNSFISASGKIFSIAGNYTDTIQNYVGCDSIISIQLSTKDSTLTIIKASICQGKNYTLPNGSIVNSSGIYNTKYISYNGCDSTISVILTVKNKSTAAVSATICNGKSYQSASGKTFTTAGIYKDTIPNFIGCDSIITINLSVKNKSLASFSTTICKGNSFISASGKTFTTAGIYKDTIPNFIGCDSIITINLSVKNKSLATVSATICKGNSFISANGKTFTIAGNYTDTIQNYVGCDSIISIQLSTKDSTLTIIKASICQGKNYTLPNGSIVNSSGIYNTKYISHNGCDSTIQTQLTLLSNSSSNQTIIICEGDSAKLPNGNYVFYDGNYFTNLINHVNCDSTINTVINVMPQFKTNLNPDTSICSDKILLLNVNPNNLVGGNFSWNLGINKPIYEISTSGLFIVTATFPPCKSVSDSIMVTLIDCSCNVYMPNAFSPNLDNLNDRIKPIFDCYPLPIDYRFSIYNRWGQLVFTTTNLDESWDGTFKNRDQEISTFDYIITYRQNLESNKIIKKGNISMLR